MPARLSQFKSGLERRSKSRMTDVVGGRSCWILHGYFASRKHKRWWTGSTPRLYRCRHHERARPKSGREKKREKRHGGKKDIDIQALEKGKSVEVLERAAAAQERERKAGRNQRQVTAALRTDGFSDDSRRIGRKECGCHSTLDNFFFYSLYPNDGSLYSLEV